MIRFAKGMNAFGKDEFLWNWDDKRDGWIPSESGMIRILPLGGMIA